MSHHIVRLQTTGVNEAAALGIAATQLASFIGVDQPTALQVLDEFATTDARPITTTTDGAVTTWQVDAEVDLDAWRASL